MDSHTRRRRVLLGLLFLGNAIAWAIPCNVLKNVARDQHTLLGRYGYAQFLWMVVAALGSLAAWFIAGAPPGRPRRLRAFRLVALVLSLAAAITLADIPLRLRHPPTYRLDRMAFRRPANTRWTVIYDDQPEARRSYPVVRPGFGRVECVFTTDANGYRNKTVPARCDVVALGDSFTEGSRVGDDECWPARFAKRTGQWVYNLGMSGYSPQHYVESLKVEGLRLAPSRVICTIYEGNDFRETKVITSSQLRIKQIFRSSPILQALDRVLVQGAGAVGAARPLPELDTLSWLPLGIPDGPDAKYYAFAPKQLTELCRDIDRFKQDRKWTLVTDTLMDLRNACVEAGAELVLVYVPDKAHVVLAPAADRLPAEKVRSFVALTTDTPLPEPKLFLAELLSRLDARENLVAHWCRSRSIRFLSLTPALRAAARAGRQVYYTYDQHWTPVGHDVAAQAISDFCINSPLTAGAPAP